MPFFSNRRKSPLIVMLLALFTLAGCGGSNKKDDGIVRTENAHTYDGYPVVYITPDVSSEGLLAAYDLLESSGGKNVVVTLPDSETDPDFVWSDLTGDLLRSLGSPTILESDMAADFSERDYTIVLSHFRSHEYAGFNGAVKQAAIISFSSEKTGCPWEGQAGLELLAENGKHTSDALDGAILYISVMDRLSIESGGARLPDTNTYNIGILSSYDPVALDQACIDLVYMLREGAPLAAHINSCNGLYTLAYAEQIGLGSRTYALTVTET